MRLQGSCKAPAGMKTKWGHAKSRSGKSKTAAEGRVSWRKVRREKKAAVEEQKAAVERAKLEAKFEAWEAKEKSERVALAFKFYCQAWADCTIGNDFVMGWESAKRRILR